MGGLEGERECADRLLGCGVVKGDTGRRAGTPARGGVQGEVETGERIDKEKSLVVGFTPAAWKPVPASRCRHQRHPSGVVTRDPRHKPAQPGASEPLGTARNPARAALTA